MKFGDFPATLFSPAKLVYIGYVLLAALGRIDVSILQFLLASLVFLAVQIWHDDYFRIVLNQKAAARIR